MSKTCKNCHDLKSLKKDLQTSYDQFRSLAESKSQMENGYMSQIDELNQEIEYLKNINEKQSTEIYRLKCENESLINQNESKPGLATLNRYKEDMIEHARERTKAWQLAAAARRKEVEALNKVKELESVVDQLKDRLYDCLINGGVS